MLEPLLASAAQAVTCETVGEWWPRHRSIAAEHPASIQQAIAGGFAADRVGWAFASGYQAALHALFPGAPEDRICALCVTEAEGNSPKAIKSSLKRQDGGWRLDGAKRWTTLGPDGALFFVAARDETASGERIALKVVKVLSDAAGVSMQRMPDTRFVPEVPHAQLQFENVSVTEDALLPGDGYDRYVKPFRTVEDIHVNAAILAYLVREARRLAWADNWIERCMSVLYALKELSREKASSAQTHIDLAGTLAIGSGLIGETEAFWEAAASDPASGRWKRDRELLQVAGGIRAQRTKRAWESLRPAG